MVERQKLIILEIEGKEQKIAASFAETQKFIKEAIKEGAHLITPPTSSEERWIRIRNIIGVYAGSPATLEQIADTTVIMARGRRKDTEDRLTGENIRQLFKKGIIYLHNNSSEELQAKYPLEELGTRKPPKIRKDSLTAKVKQAAEQGATLTDLKKIAGSSDALAYPRKILGKHGIVIPLFYQKYRNLENDLQRETDDQKLQELLGKVSLDFYRKHLKGDQPLFTSLKSLLKEAGYHIAAQHKILEQFKEALKGSGVAVGTLKQEIKLGRQKGKKSYNFILTKQKQRTIDTWRANLDLKRFLVNPVSQISGPQVSAIPTTTELPDREKFISCAKIFTEATGRYYKSLVSPRGHLSDLIGLDCPVPIFKFQKKFQKDYRCLVSDEEALIEYFRNKFA